MMNTLCKTIVSKKMHTISLQQAAELLKKDVSYALSNYKTIIWTLYTHTEVEEVIFKNNHFEIIYR